MPRGALAIWIVATGAALAALIALGVPVWLRIVAIVAWSLVWGRYHWQTVGRERVERARRERARRRDGDGAG